MSSRCEIVERTDHESHVKELIPKFQFFKIDDKELENVNKGGQRVNKQTELWVKNAFDEWRLFCGFDALKFIVDLFVNGGLIKDLADMLFSFVLQVAKKMTAYILLLGTLPYHFLNVSLQEKLSFVT
jgi:hypothetical protein